MTEINPNPNEELELQELEARLFQLVGRQGEVQGEWKIVDGNPCLTMLDLNGRVRMQLDLSESERPRITMYDEDGRPRLMALLSEEDESPEIAFFDQNGEVTLL